MRDGAILQMPYELRTTFAALLAFEDVIDPVALWNEFKDDMCEDVLYKRRQVSHHY